MLSIRTLAFALFLGLFVAVGSVEAQEKFDGPHFATGTGSTEAEAKAAAEQDMQDIVDDFIDNLDPPDHVRRIVAQPGTWDGTTYTIEFTIVWIDRVKSQADLRSR